MKTKDARLHVPRLIRSHDLHPLIHGSNRFGRLNTWLAVRITKGVGTMVCAYLFAVLALISLPAAIMSHSPIIIIGWIAQTLLQLVLLPIIIVGQNVNSAQQDAQAEADHETLTALHDLNKTQLEILERLESK